MKEDSITRIKNFYLECQKKTDFFFGFPINLNYDYTEILDLFQFSLNNAGDPFIPSSYKIESREFELEVLDFFAQLYQCENYWGYITNCGSESNLHGILRGRETYPNGILYSSADSHYSINKAAYFLRMHHIQVKSQIHGEMDYSDFLDVLNPDYPAIINLNIGTTFTGAVDNLDRILEALEAKQITKFYIHCDGALGGMLIPYLAPPNLINFKRPIHSLAISGHKFIGCPFPCGIFLTHKDFVAEFSNITCQDFPNQFGSNVEYLNTKDTTIGGSRNGHAPVFLWYAIQKRKHLFENEAKLSVSNANYFHEQLKKIGLSSLLNPYSTTVVFPKPTDDIVNKWQLITLGNKAHAIIMQNHDKNMIDNLIADLTL